jgi:hypothetical protein
VTVATSAGGVVSPSLHVPNVLSIGPLHVPAPLRCSDLPIGSLPSSRTPMSVDTWPAAAPLAAVNTPSYDRNSMTVPAALTSAIASGLSFAVPAPPFWIPLAG